MSSYNINYFLIHCDEHIERIDNIINLQNIINQQLYVFKGYYTKNIDTDYNSKLQYLKAFDKNLKLKKNVLFKSGEIGCYLSHHMLIKDILSSSNDKDYSVIFEDDVTCKETLHENIGKIIQNMYRKQLDWDIIFLGNLTKNHSEKVIHNIYTIDKNNVCTGTHALLINNKNIQKMYDTNCNISNAIDFQYKKNIDNSKLNGYVIFPPICFQNKIFHSNIQ